VPTYQYACTECGHDFEAVQSFADASLTECPRCHGRLRKVFGAVGIVFKGSGFYRNDSRDKKATGTDGDAKTKDAPAAKDSGATPVAAAGGTPADKPTGKTTDKKVGPAVTKSPSSTADSAA
jgi:putative FmdB family regulatory protein